MKQKIFLFIATFCIALVKSEEEDLGYPGDLSGAVLLSEADSLWGDDDLKHKNFQECYKTGNIRHRAAIEKFYNEILQAANKLTEELGTENDFKTLAQQAQASAKALADLLKKDQEQFSLLVNEGKINEIQNRMEENQNKIEESELTLDGDILKLKEMTFKKEDLNKIVKNFEKIRNNKLINLTDTCEEVMKLLKQCMKEKL